MLNNKILVKRLKKLFKYLKERWNITPYRIAIESGIPHASLKYMMDEKFEWKLNHLLSIVDFLNRNNAKINLTNLLDFKNNRTMSEIMNDEKAYFRHVKYGETADFSKYLESNEKPVQKSPEVILKESKKESEELAKDIDQIIKESRLVKTYKISVDLKVSDKKFDFKKELKFADGKKIKS